MSNDIKDIVKEYVLKNPTSHATDIADLIVEDAVTTLSHRTLRRYVSEVKDSLDLSTTVDDIEDQIADNNDLIDKLADMLIEDVTNKITLVKRQPKILLFDIETARMIFGAWAIGKQYLGPDQIIADWFILGWSAKWLFSPVVMSDFVTSEEAIDRDDKRICESLWKLINEAEIIITHNGNKFDLPKINSRFLLNGLSPTMPYLSIDTYKVASKQFGFSSNSLKWIAKITGNREKIKTDYDLWIGCERGEQESLDKMHTYCIGDTQVLEEVYLELRPWIKSHANLPVLMNMSTQACPNCGGTTFTEEGVYTTAQNQYTAVRCSECGAVNRKSKSNLTQIQRASLLVPAAR